VRLQVVTFIDPQPGLQQPCGLFAGSKRNSPCLPPIIPCRWAQLSEGDDIQKRR
jgi:hypothetical protein